MGKRKSKTKVITKKKDTKLAKSFQCIFCQHPDSVTVSFTTTAEGRVARLGCKVCDVKWNTSASKIAQDIDIYSAWLDEADEANHAKAEDSE